MTWYEADQIDAIVGNPRPGLRIIKRFKNYFLMHEKSSLVLDVVSENYNLLNSFGKSLSFINFESDRDALLCELREKSELIDFNLDLLKNVEIKIDEETEGKKPDGQ